MQRLYILLPNSIALKLSNPESAIAMLMLLPSNCFHLKPAYAKAKCSQVQVDWNHQKTLNLEIEFEVWSNYVIGWFLILSYLRLNPYIKWQTLPDGIYWAQESFVKNISKEKIMTTLCPQWYPNPINTSLKLQPH